jgi:hypothetical protein
LGANRLRRVRRAFASLVERLRWFVRAIEEGDETMVEEVLRLSRSRRLFAPLAYTVGAFAMLVGGLRRLLTNWRLIPVELLPAVWLWLAMYDLKLHVLSGTSFHSAHEAELVPIALLIFAVTVVALFLQVVFAFAVAQSGTPSIPHAFAEARRHSLAILVAGGTVGLLLAAGTTFGAQLKHHWFTLSLGATVALMMVVYLSLPARLLRLTEKRSRRDRVAATALGGLLATVVSTPPYLLSRLGVLLLSSGVLAIPGYILITIGVLLQTGATSAVRAIRMSGALVSVKETDRDLPAGRPG